MVILSACRFKAFGVEDGKLVHGVLPVLGRPSPVGGDIAQGQPDQFAGSIVTREMPACLDDLAQSGVDAFNGISSTLSDSFSLLRDLRLSCGRMLYIVIAQSIHGVVNDNVNSNTSIAYLRWSLRH